MLLQEKKIHAHDLMDHISRDFNMTADEIYRRLRRGLGCKPGKEHFRNMHTFDEVEEATVVLRDIRGGLRKQRKRRLKKKNPVLPQIKPKTLPTLDYRAAIEKLEKDNAFIRKFPKVMQPLIRRALHH